MNYVWMGYFTGMIKKLEMTIFVKLRTIFVNCKNFSDQSSGPNTGVKIFFIKLQ